MIKMIIALVFALAVFGVWWKFGRMNPEERLAHQVKRDTYAHNTMKDVMKDPQNPDWAFLLYCIDKIDRHTAGKWLAQDVKRMYPSEWSFFQKAILEARQEHKKQSST
jgi:hypothetical protein